MGSTRAFKAAGLAALLFAAAPAEAAPYTNLFVFGASESDSGNIYSITKGTTPTSPPYAQRYSNGPVAVEYFAQALGIPFTYSQNSAASAGQGLNFAIGGSLTDNRNNVVALGNGYGIQNQVNDFTARVSAQTLSFDPTSTLFLIIGGGNDILRVGFYGSDPNTVVSNAVNSISNEVKQLAAAGAAHIALSTVNNIGTLPTAGSRAAQYAQLSRDLNTAYRGLAPTLAASTGKDVSIIDRGAILDNIIGNYAAYGFTNATTPCVVGTTVCTDVDQRVFWDSVHVTTRVHQLVGTQLAAVVSPTEVPEPMSVAVFGIALAALTLTRRAKA